MFVAIYRWRLHPGREDAFREGWGRITRLARERCGSGGSALFRDGDGTWVAIARWPSREAREACFAAGSLDPEASALMRGAVAEALPDQELEGDMDLWAPLGPPGPTGAPVARLAELEVDPGRLDEYRGHLREEVEASLAREPGVLALQAVALPGRPASIRLLEVYASPEAYEAHLRSPHFLRYKEATAGMVLSLRLIEAEPVALRSRPLG